MENKAGPVSSGRCRDTQRTRLQRSSPKRLMQSTSSMRVTVKHSGTSDFHLRVCVRCLAARRVWFGINRSHRRLLDESTWNEWQNLLRDLREHRSASALDHRHAFYRAAPEAWLESLLRRDITKLDPGLIIAPLHAQFRTARGAKLGIRPIDLLALRQDGRLVVIELKVSEDREHVLQGADYWRRVEAHRRRGHIARAKLFGERKIRDESPLVYLVAPTLRVHPSFQTLAQCISQRHRDLSLRHQRRLALRRPRHAPPARELNVRKVNRVNPTLGFTLAMRRARAANLSV